MSNQFVTKSFLWWCVVLILIILFAFWAYRTGTALYHNHQLRVQLPTSTSDSPYRQQVPMEQMDLTAYDTFFPKNFAAVDYPLTHRIETPVTLRYYSEIPTDKTDVVLEIAKGTTIIAVPENTTGSAFQVEGYGYTSYPTYKEGWRYVRPFMTTEGMDQAHNDQYYYVRMDSLEAVLDKVVEVNKPFQAAIRQQGGGINKGKHAIARYIDNALYQHGAYLSPDLFYRVVDRWNTMLLSAIGLIIVLLLLNRGTWIRKNK